MPKDPADAFGLLRKSASKMKASIGSFVVG